MADYVIREALISDCDQIERLIKELACYEKLLDDVVVTATQLREDGFGVNPFFRCLVAEKLCHKVASKDSKQSDGQLIAHLLFCFHYSTFDGPSLYIEDIYVSPEYRNRGIALEMLQRLASIAIDCRRCRVELACLGWNEPTIEWYGRRGIVDVTDSEQVHMFRMDLDDIRRTAGQPVTSLLVDYAIRETSIDDCDQLFCLIRKRADQENKLDKVTLTATQLRDDGFGANPLFGCLVVENSYNDVVGDNKRSVKLVAYFLYCFNFSTFDGRTLILKDTFVLPEHRNRGIASAMLQRLASVAVSVGCRRLELCCVAWNELAVNWFCQRGIADVTESELWHMFRLDGAALCHLASDSNV